MERTERAPERRRQNFRSVIHGSLNPRRRHNRRSADDQTMILDWHDAGLFMLAVSIMVMSCLDAFFTLQIIGLGGEELNMAMQVMLNVSTEAFLVVKYTATGLGVILLVACARMRLAGLLRVRWVLQGVSAIYAILIVYELYLLLVVARAVNF